MGSQNPLPNWTDPELLSSIELAFDATWPAIRARETCPDRDRIAELGIMLSRKLVELAADGVRDPLRMRQLALESFSPG
jgi:hypothetical protein